MNYDQALKKWDDRRAVMAKLRRQNVSVREIAARYGISTQRCYQILRATGDTAPKRSLKGGQNRPLKQAKYEQSGPKRSKIDPDR